MRLGVRGRLFLVSLALILVSLIAGDAWLSGALDRYLTARIEDDLEVRLAVAQRDVEQTRLGPGDFGGWDALADDLGGRAHARVTIIRLDGVVLGDSEVALADLAAVENHAERPEVQAALARGRGSAQRLSATVRQRMMYVALPWRSGGALQGVVRAAVPLDEVDAAVSRARWLLVIGSLIALGVAVLVSSGAAQRLSRVVRGLTATARRMAAGDLDARARVGGSDELAELGRTLDHLAGGLSDTLGELRAERDRMRGILAAMQEGVLVLDSAGTIALVNPALREMLLLPADVLGKPPLEVLRHAELQEILARAVGPDGPASGEIDVAGVKPRRLLVRASPLRGEIEGILVVVFDVTDLRRLEGLRRDFVANVSHELRTPVTAIRSAVETLEAGAAGDKEAAQRFLDIMSRNADRLQQLVEDLLDLSRIESRQYHLRPEPVELVDLLQHAVTLARERAEKKRIALEVKVPPLPPIQADRRALEQVVSNLIDNAVKYCGDGCKVAIGAEPRDHEILVTVKDNGPGIASRHLPRLFERFYRVDAGRSRDQGGTGLGLSIVKHLVEAMGGHVAVDSAPGQGATFSFTLPREAAA